jgi:fermentation-respiration switch protein FrsA (DUF1100 family)
VRRRISPTLRHLALALLVAAVVVARPASRMLLSYLSKRASFVSAQWAVPAPPDSLALGLIAVAFPTGSANVVHGWYLPSRTGAAVVLGSGSDADRSTMLDEARALATAGIGVLLFDWPGRGESEGSIAFAAPERAALEGALDLVAGRPDVDSTRIGALGFSMGGYILAQVAASDRRIRAVALSAAPADMVEQTRAEYERGGAPAQWGAVLALRMAGMPLRYGRPLDVVRAIAPRPVLIINGDADPVVPPALSRRLYEAAATPKDLWIIHGAGHGGYARADSTYGRRLAKFFTVTLRPDAAP